jgi:hypothetical protein
MRCWRTSSASSSERQSRRDGLPWVAEHSSVAPSNILPPRQSPGAAAARPSQIGKHSDTSASRSRTPWKSRSRPGCRERLARRVRRSAAPGPPV